MRSPKEPSSVGQGRQKQTTMEETVVMFSEQLECELQRKNISQAKFSEISGLTQAAVSQLISGKRRPTVATLLKVCSALNTTPNDLLAFHSGRRHEMQKEISDLKWKLQQVRKLVN